MADLIPGRPLICPFRPVSKAIHLCKRTFPPKRSVTTVICSYWNLKISLTAKISYSLFILSYKKCYILYQNCHLAGNLKSCATLVYSVYTFFFTSKLPLCVSGRHKDVRTTRVFWYKFSPRS